MVRGWSAPIVGGVGDRDGAFQCCQQLRRERQTLGVAEAAVDPEHAGAVDEGECIAGILDRVPDQRPWRFGHATDRRFAEGGAVPLGEACGECLVVAGPSDPGKALALGVLEDVVPDLVEEDVEEQEGRQARTRPLDDGRPGRAVGRHDGTRALECRGVVRGNRAQPAPGRPGHVVKRDSPGYAEAAEGRDCVTDPGRAIAQLHQTQSVKRLGPEAAEEARDFLAVGRMAKAGARRRLDNAGQRRAGGASSLCPAAPRPPGP